MKKIAVLQIVFLLFSMNIFSQTIDIGFNEERIKMRVKQIDEFRDRFNLKKDLNGELIKNRQNVKMRKNYILNLFNEELYKNKPKDKSDIIKDFITYVSNLSDPKYINFEDSNWYAEATCMINYNGKVHDLSVVLKIEKIKKYEYKWVIVSVEGSFLKLTPYISNPGMIISPIDNELGFMTLPDITKDNTENIILYAQKAYKPDELTVFFTLINSGKLKIVKVKEIQYHFLQIPGWIFTVNHFERDSDNVGWLISAISKTNEKGKKEYKKHLLNIN